MILVSLTVNSAAGHAQECTLSVCDDHTKAIST